MLDYAIVLAPELHQAIKATRDLEGAKLGWLRRCREMERSDKRARREQVVPRTVIVSKPANLAGIHKMWI